MSPEHGLLVVIYNVDGASRIKKSYTTDTSNGPSSSLADINLGLTGVVGHIEIKAPSDGAGRELTRLPSSSLRPPLPTATSLTALLHKLLSFPSAFPASFLRRMLGPLTDHAVGCPAATLGFAITTASSPMDTYTLDLSKDGGEPVRWTEAEIGGLDGSKLVTPDLIRYLDHSFEVCACDKTNRPSSVTLAIKKCVIDTICSST